MNNSKAPFLFAVSMIVGFLFSASPVFAAKEKFERVKPHTNVQATPSAGNTITAKVADLMVLSARVKKHAMKCQDGHVLFSVMATVKNVGTGSFPNSVTSAGDTHAFPNTNPWGSGVSTPALNPGQQASVTIPINYHHQYKDHIPGFHQFRVIANDWGYKHKKGENNFANNVRMVSVSIPKDVCGKPVGQPPQPGKTGRDIQIKGKKILEN